MKSYAMEYFLGDVYIILELDYDRRSYSNYLNTIFVVLFFKTLRIIMRLQLELN